MTEHKNPPELDLRYSSDETPPFGLSLLLAIQIVFLIVAGIVLTPAIVLRGAEMPASMESSVIFYALVISGLTTILQARKVWRFGAGYILLMGTSGAFIAVSIAALKSGGMGLLMTLIVVSSFIQFLFANHLGLLRRIVTPLVGGTTIMLLAVTVMPIAFKHLPSAGSGDYQGPLVAGITLATILLLSFFGSRSIRLWSPIIGIFIGSVVSAMFGEFDTSRITSAAWIGTPELQWTGFDLSFGQEFWLLIPAFCIVTIVGAIETYGDAVAIQRLSTRKEKPVDFRVVQGALYADGLGNFLSGCAGTMPNTTYSTSISVVDITGVAARRVGMLCGVVLLVIAFFPKVSAVILSIPVPVVGSYLLVLILLLFMHGLRMVAKDGLTYEKGFIVGMGFWLGAGFQQKAIFYESIPPWLSPILDNGMTSGTVVTLLLVAVLNLKKGTTRKINSSLSKEAIIEIQEFSRQFCVLKKWDHDVIHKLELAAEESILALLEIRESANHESCDKLIVELRANEQNVEMDIAVSSVIDNLEELVSIAKSSEQLSMKQIPFQILGLITEDIRHFQFHGVDFINLKINTTSQLSTHLELN